MGPHLRFGDLAREAIVSVAPGRVNIEIKNMKKEINTPC
jgi:hypothetical protein